MFKAELRQYRIYGAESFRADLSSMIQKAMRPKAGREYLHFVADVCMDLKAFDKAEPLLREVAARFGETDVLLNLLAFCAWEQGAEDQAFAAYCKSLALNPENVSSLRGACFLAIEKDCPDALGYCKQFYLRSGQTHEAAVWFATALHNSAKKTELKMLVSEWQQQFGGSEELAAFVS